MHTQNPVFKKANKEEKIELIERDAYSLMINYLVEKIELLTFQNEIIKLAEFGFHSNEELIEFIKDRINYEAFQYSHGKSTGRRNQIKNRVKEFKES